MTTTVPLPVSLRLLRPSIRPGTLAPAIAAATLCAFLVLFLVPAETATAVSTSIQTATLLTALAFMARRAGRSDGALAQAQRLFAGALAVCGGGAILLTSYPIIDHPLAVATLAPAVTVPWTLLAGYGFWVLPRRAGHGAGDLRIVLDCIIAGSALLFLAWLFLLEPIIEAAGAAPAVSATRCAYVVGDVLVIAVALAVLPFLRGDVRRPLGQVVTGLFLVAAGNVVAIRALVHSHDLSFGWPDLLIQAGLLLVVLGTAARPGTRAPRPCRNPAFLTTLPVGLAVVVGFAYVASGRLLGVDDVVTAAVMIIALLYRERIASRDLVVVAQAHERAAMTDELTGLPNRRAFLGRVTEHLTTPGLPPVAVVLVDLNGFKEINDSFGHHVGDDVLQQAAGQLRRLCHGHLAARLGGDEFAVACLSSDGVAEAQALAAAIAGLHHVPTREHGTLSMTYSAGVGVSVATDTTASQVLRRADLAMYAAKSDPTTPLRVFDCALEAAASRKHLLLSALEGAADNGELHLVYQPLHDLADGRVVGAEALLRWEHPELGTVSPGEFIPLAEETGQIVALGDWVLAEAVAQVSAWQRQGYYLPRLLVNVSARQFTPGFADRVAWLLDRHGLPAPRLTLEVTESQLASLADMGPALQRLQALGTRLALDDFGTGYSSLARLARLPVDILKIDRQFIIDVEQSADRELFRGIVTLAQTMQMTTVVEGIETPEQLEIATRCGATYGQGFLLARPMRPDELAGRLPLLPSPAARRDALPALSA